MTAAAPRASTTGATVRDGNRVGDVRDGGKGYVVRRHHGAPVGEVYAVGHMPLPKGKAAPVWTTDPSNATWWRTSNQADAWMRQWCSTGDPSVPHVASVALPDGRRGAR